MNCRLRSINACLAWRGSALRVPKLKEEEFLPGTFSPEDITTFAQWKPEVKVWPESKAAGPNLG